MIVSLGERAFQAGWTSPLEGAVRPLLMAHKLGFHAVMVSPAALAIAEQLPLPNGVLEEVRVIHRAWLASQGLARRATRVIELTADVGEHGEVVENKYFVFNGSVASIGLCRESALIVESLTSDRPWIELMLKVFYDWNDFEARRFWAARFEQGGGGTSHECIRRYPNDTYSTFLLCDRDSEQGADCGETARMCVEAALHIGAYADFEQGLAGGFSPYLPNFGMRLTGAWEVENLVLPHVMELFFTNIKAGGNSDAKLALIRAEFPSFPRLNNDEARRWLNIDFRKWPGFGKVFKPSDLKEISTWAGLSDDNMREFRARYRKDLEVAEFYLCVDEIARDILTLGLRNSSMM